LVGATDFAPNTIWSKKFLEAQGHQITTNYFEQDNVSAIRLEKNGKASVGRQSRHIDIRYFFLKDRVKQDDITIRHCPTEAMLADFLTKPLQGELFRRFRDVLMGLKHTDSLVDALPTNTSSNDERVGNKIKNEVVRVQSEKNEKKELFDRDSYVFGGSPKKSSEANERRDEVGTSRHVEGTWSLVVSKKTKKSSNTGHHRTKHENENVYKSNHKFVNNPS
jgi:hypothetical protein